MRVSSKPKNNTTGLPKQQKGAKRYHSANQNIKSPSIEKVKPCPIPNNNHDIKDLLEREGDTYEDLKLKNSKLRMLIIQASTKLSEMTNKYNQMESEYKLEKKTFLSELDKISQNYKTYAENAKLLPQMKNDYQALLSKYNQNNKVIENYQENIKSLLKDFIQLHSNICNYIENTTANSEFISSPADAFGFVDFLRGVVYKNIEKYQKDIDSVNFGSFYNTYHDYIRKNMSNKETEQSDSKKNVLKKKRAVTMRKKEYIGLGDSEHDTIRSNNGNEIQIMSQRNKYRFNKDVIKRTNSFDCVNNTNDV